MVSHNKPFIFVPRPLFCEQEGLLNHLMIPFGRCIKMDISDFESGNWIPSILQAIELPCAESRLSFDGHVDIANLFEHIYNEKN